MLREAQTMQFEVESVSRLSAAIEDLRPGIKVIFMSGYTDEAMGHHGVLAAGTRFIQNPFAAAALLRKIREALDEAVPDIGHGDRH
jgi:FixJ family two-component response regulator